MKTYQWHARASYYGQQKDVTLEQSRNGCGDVFRVVSEDIETGMKETKTFRGEYALTKAAQYARDITAPAIDPALI